MMQQNYAGYQIGQYELRGILGEGGMGTVYLAFQKNLRREVAVKLLPTRLASEAQYMERFTREAQMAASLEHPYIVPVYDYGTQDDISFIAMRYLKGGTLDDRLQAAKQAQQMPSLGEIADLLEKIGAAMHYAHQRGVIHRDIKSSNIMFDEMGTPYITDFGIARALEGTSSLTATGMTVGTPAYMSPELWKGGNVTAASDQYALAILAYYMITGQHPYEAPTPYALMNKHLSEPPPTINRADVPLRLAKVFEQALAKDPLYRYGSTEGFAQAFRVAVRGAEGNPTGFAKRRVKTGQVRKITGGLTAGGSSIAPPPQTRRASSGGGGRWVWGGIGLMLLLGVALIGYALFSDGAFDQDAIRTQVAIEADQTEFANTQAAIALQPTVTPNENQVEAQATAIPPTAIPPTAIPPTDIPPTVAERVLPTVIPPSDTPIPPPTATATATVTEAPPTSTPTDIPPTATPTPRIVAMASGESSFETINSGRTDIREVRAAQGEVIEFQVNGQRFNFQATAQMVGLPNTLQQTVDGDLILRYPAQADGIYQMQLDVQTGGGYELAVQAYPAIEPFTKQRILASLADGDYIEAEAELMTGNILELTSSLITVRTIGDTLFNGADVFAFVAGAEIDPDTAVCGFEVFSGTGDSISILVDADGVVEVIQDDETLLQATHLPAFVPGSSFVIVSENNVLTLFVDGLYAGRVTDLDTDPGQVQLRSDGEACTFEDVWALSLDPLELEQAQATENPVVEADPTETIPFGDENAILAYSSQNVNVRAGDSTSYSVVGSLRPDEPARIIGVSSTGSGWYRIELQNGRYGWVSPGVVTTSETPRDLLAYDPPQLNNTANNTATNDSDTTQPAATEATTVEQDPTTDDPQTDTAAADEQQPDLPYDCSTFTALEPSTGLVQGNNTFYWSPAGGQIDSYWVSVFNESGQQIGLANVPGNATSTSIFMEFDSNDGFTISWQVTAQYGPDIVCGTPFKQVARGF